MSKPDIYSEKMKRMQEEAEESGVTFPDFASLPDTTEAEEQCRRLEHRIQSAQERCRSYFHVLGFFFAEVFSYIYYIKN